MPATSRSPVPRPSLTWLIATQWILLAAGLWICATVELTLPAAQQAITDGSTAATESTSTAPIDDGWTPHPRLLAFGWIAVLQGLALWLYESRTRQFEAGFAESLESQQTQLLGDVVRLRDAVVFGLAKLAESRDSDTGQHLERIAAYSTRLAQHMRRDARFAPQITGQFVQEIGVSSALHDIGKVAVEDAILLKPGPLTAEERERMQVHAKVGAQCIEQIGRRLGDANFLELAQGIALHHHERWDGSGYPDGLAGENIPLAARIVAVADVYDALSSRRVYKRPIPHDHCVDIIRAEAGQQFDPDIVDIFLRNHLEFLQVRQHYIESCPSSAASAASRHREHVGTLMNRDLEQQLLTALGEKSATRPAVAAGVDP